MRNFLQRFVLHNLGLKLISLCLAIGLWLAVSRDPTAEVAVAVPIEFHHIPDKLEISSEHIPQTQVRVRGPEQVIRRVQPDDVHVEIDLTGTKPGERTFDLSSQQVRQPHDLEVVQVVPSQLHLSFDERLDRVVEVRARVVGNFAHGYRLAQVQVDPPQIAISGPRKRVEAVEAAITDPVDVSGTMLRNTFVTHAYVSDPLVQVVRPGPVRVTVIMEKVTVEDGGH
jgi:diadenylate cyclase